MCQRVGRVSGILPESAREIEAVVRSWRAQDEITNARKLEFRHDLGCGSGGSYRWRPGREAQRVQDGPNHRWLDDRRDDLRRPATRWTHENFRLAGQHSCPSACDCVGREHARDQLAACTSMPMYCSIGISSRWEFCNPQLEDVRRIREAPTFLFWKACVAARRRHTLMMLSARCPDVRLLLTGNSGPEFLSMMRTTIKI